MKNVFSVRRRQEFTTLLSDLCDSVTDALGTSQDARIWVETTRDALAADADSVVDGWYRRMNTPLTREHAKYTRAVESITGAPPVLYHAIVYKDAEAAQRCSPPIPPINLPACVSSMTPDQMGILWTFLSELSTLAYKCMETPPPAVPSVDQITANIRTRRENKRDTRADVPGIVTGINEVWKQLAQSRGANEELEESMRLRVRMFLRDTQVIDGVKISAAFPELGNEPYTPEQIQMVERIQKLVTMDDAIPRNMMTSIENVASKLVTDLNSGNCDLSSLNLEQIGEQVMASVSEDDMGNFAKNIDKILPALGGLPSIPK